MHARLGLISQCLAHAVDYEIVDCKLRESYDSLCVIVCMFACLALVIIDLFQSLMSLRAL